MAKLTKKCVACKSDTAMIGSMVCAECWAASGGTAGPYAKKHAVASSVDAKNPHAVAMGHLGGTARAKRMTPEQRSEASRYAGTFSIGWPKGKPRGPRKGKPAVEVE